MKVSGIESELQEDGSRKVSEVSYNAQKDLQNQVPFEQQKFVSQKIIQQ